MTLSTFFTAVKLSVVVCIGAGMGMSAVADTVALAPDTVTSFTMTPELAPFFDTTQEQHLLFEGLGASSGAGWAQAPVGAVTVTSDPGSLVIRWGEDLWLHDTFWVMGARNFSLNVADRLVYADVTFYDPSGQGVEFTQLGIFSLVGLTGTLDGVDLDQVSALTLGGPGQLSLSAAIYANNEALNEITMTMNGQPFPTDGSVSFYGGQLTVGAVPEPGTWFMMGLGLAGLLMVKARRRIS